MNESRKRKIRRYALIAFVAAIAGFILWNMHHANEVYERYVQSSIAAEAAIARSEASLGRR